MNVADLRPSMRNVDVTVQVEDVVEDKEITSKKDGSQHHLKEYLVGDESGSVVMSLWDESADAVSPGDYVHIENGYTTVIRGHLRLNVGKYGKMEKVEENFEANTDNNVSDREFQQPRRYDFPGRGRSFGGRGRY